MAGRRRTPEEWRAVLAERSRVTCERRKLRRLQQRLEYERKKAALVQKRKARKQALLDRQRLRQAQTRERIEADALRDRDRKRRDKRLREDEFLRASAYDERKRPPYATTDNEFTYTGEELAFLKAIDRAKRGKSCFSLVDGFRVAKAMGYRRG